MTQPKQPFFNANPKGRLAAAKLCRAVTVPSILAAFILLGMAVVRPDAFRGIAEILWGLFYLSVCPLLAYLIAFLVPSVRAKGHNGARKLAFITSLIGYTGGAFYALFTQTSFALSFIFFTYLFSGLFLFLMNKLLHVRASGHACGATGPVLLFGILVGKWMWVLSLALYMIAAWGSFSLKRHSVREFIWGSLCCIGGFAASALCCGLVFL